MTTDAAATNGRRPCREMTRRRRRSRHHHDRRERFAEHRYVVLRRVGRRGARPRRVRRIPSPQRPQLPRRRLGEVVRQLVFRRWLVAVACAWWEPSRRWAWPGPRWSTPNDVVDTCEPGDSGVDTARDPADVLRRRRSGGRLDPSDRRRRRPRARSARSSISRRVTTRSALRCPRRSRMGPTSSGGRRSRPIRTRSAALSRSPSARRRRPLRA